MINSKTILISIYAFLLPLLVTNIKTAIADDNNPKTKTAATKTVNDKTDFVIKIPFKCSNENCGHVHYCTIDQIQEMLKSSKTQNVMGPLVIECPKCKQHTLTQAVECPECKNIFTLKMKPDAGTFDDHCPKCGVSYSKAWQKKAEATVKNSNVDVKIPFKCSDEKCGEVVYLTLEQIIKLQKPNSTQPAPQGTIAIECPKCKKKTLTPALECPKCKCIYNITKDTAIGGLGGKCPKCGTDYLKALQEKYSKTTAPPNAQMDWDKKIPFKCSDEKCGETTYFTHSQLRKMSKPGATGPMLGPLVLDCPKCKKHTLTQAVECPKCKNIFIMKMNPAAGIFDDKCPKCGISYSKAWQEEYKKKQNLKKKDPGVN